ALQFEWTWRGSRERHRRSVNEKSRKRIARGQRGNIDNGAVAALLVEYRKDGCYQKRGPECIGAKYLFQQFHGGRFNRKERRYTCVSNMRVDPSPLSWHLLDQTS